MRHGPRPTRSSRTGRRSRRHRAGADDDRGTSGESPTA
jgi:hypothetical protein